ncbi:hypothetical protein CSOJ01_03660 [Colletotrichum sojae]|uniref:Clr5 domain-containing protein n=1 Tax=Colletotrichum sojae TaxID=2175907 RepID=A0A8H6N0L8_9PEZI|nr:hypothetical protein CSOJ01_03660 [Colletotrichum sojae]
MEPSDHPGSGPVSGFDLLHIPYDERRGHLKTIMVDAYLGKTGAYLTYPKLAELMKDNHEFSAEVHQDRHRFKKCDIRKRAPTTEKKAILRVATIGKRPHASASTSNVTIHQGGVTKKVDRKQTRTRSNDFCTTRSATIPSSACVRECPPSGIFRTCPHQLHNQTVGSPIPFGVDSSHASVPAEFDLSDQSSGTPWPARDTQNRTLQRTMEESFEHCRFSKTPSDELPILNDLVAQAVSKSPEELALDPIAFAIMSGNRQTFECVH